MSDSAWSKAKADLSLVQRQATVYTLFARKHKSIMVSQSVLVARRAACLSRDNCFRECSNGLQGLALWRPAGHAAAAGPGCAATATARRLVTSGRWARRCLGAYPVDQNCFMGVNCCLSIHSTIMHVWTGLTVLLASC